MIEVVAFDADDTLWHNEPLFTDTKERFAKLLAPYHEREWIDARLNETEIQNLRHYGYGIKSFALSMIETAIQLTEARITGTDIQRVLELAKEMLGAPVTLLPDAEATVRHVTASYRTIVVTKGDLFDQESKIARSGLGDLFHGIEVVSTKEPPVYRAITQRLGVEPGRFVMIGDSLRSDIIPVVEIGGHAVHIPYHTVWEHERVGADVTAAYQFHTVETIAEVPDILDGL